MEDGAAETTAPPAVTTTAPPVTEAAPEGQKVALFEAEAPTGKRVRKKTAEVYKIATPVKKEKKEIVKGDGVELGTIDNIEYQIQKFQAMSDELILAHSFLYGVQGVKLERKKSIRAFSGFPKYGAHCVCGVVAQCCKSLKWGKRERETGVAFRVLLGGLVAIVFARFNSGSLRYPHSYLSHILCRHVVPEGKLTRRRRLDG
jgi:hypothetical protein